MALGEVPGDRAYPGQLGDLGLARRALLVGDEVHVLRQLRPLRLAEDAGAPQRAPHVAGGALVERAEIGLGVSVHAGDIRRGGGTHLEIVRAHRNGRAPPLRPPRRRAPSATPPSGPAGTRPGPRPGEGSTSTSPEHPQGEGGDPRGHSRPARTPATATEGGVGRRVEDVDALGAQDAGARSAPATDEPPTCSGRRGRAIRPGPDVRSRTPMPPIVARGGQRRRGPPG